MTNIFNTKNSEVIENNETARITIPSEWKQMLNLEPGQKCTVALANGKHGLFFAVWSENQPKPEDMTRDL